MKTNTKGGGGTPRPIPPADTYLARNIMIADLGTQDKEFKGVPRKVREIWFCFELLGTKVVFNPEKGEQPFVVSNTYTNSLDEKANLKKMLEQWSGKNIEDLPLDTEGNLDIINVFKGKGCMIVVRQDKGKKDPSKLYANISSISPPMKQLGAVPKSENPLVVFDMDDSATLANFEKLPFFVQDMIKKSPEYKEIVGDASSDFESAVVDDDAPF